MQAGFEPGIFRSRGGHLTARPTRRSGRTGDTARQRRVGEEWGGGRGGGRGDSLGKKEEKQGKQEESGKEATMNEGEMEEERRKIKVCRERQQGLGSIECTGR